MMKLEVSVTRSDPGRGYRHTFYTAHIVGAGIWAAGDTPRAAVVAAAGILGGRAVRVAGGWEVLAQGQPEGLAERSEVLQQLAEDAQDMGLI